MSEDAVKTDVEKRKQLMDMGGTVDDHPAPQVVHDNPFSFQAAVYPWTMSTFGAPLTFGLKERRQRVGEEAIELLQAAGASREEIHAIVDHVMDRPTGELRQEVGGLQICIAALCNAADIDMDSARNDEFVRCMHNVEKIRKKNLNKPIF